MTVQTGQVGCTCRATVKSVAQIIGISGIVSLAAVGVF